MATVSDAKKKSPKKTINPFCAKKKAINPFD
jgi:hypothetical protein